MTTTRHFSFRFSLLSAVGIILAGCQSVPKANFDSYRRNFAVVRDGAQDLYLRAGAVAEGIANRPEADGSLAERLNRLERWRNSLKARQAAIALIDRYNGALTRLAQGDSAEALASDISSIQQDLSSFGVSHVKQLLKDASPYLAVVVQGISLVETEIKKKRFRDAVVSAQRPIGGILDILVDDASDLDNLFRQELSREQDPHRKQADSCASRFQRKLRTFKLTKELESLLDRHNAVRRRMMRDGVPPIVYNSTAAVAEVLPADVESLTMLVDQAELNVIAYNKVEEKILAHQAFMSEYRNALEATKRVFSGLPADIEMTRITATAEFAEQALNLKRAALRLQDAK